MIFSKSRQKFHRFFKILMEGTIKSVAAVTPVIAQQAHLYDELLDEKFNIKTKSKRHEKIIKF